MLAPAKAIQTAGMHKDARCSARRWRGREKGQCSEPPHRPKAAGEANSLSYAYLKFRDPAVMPTLAASALGMAIPPLGRPPFARTITACPLQVPSSSPGWNRGARQWVGATCCCRASALRSHPGSHMLRLNRLRPARVTRLSRSRVAR